MTQYSFNALYYSACQNIKAAELKLKKISKEYRTACINRRRKLDKLEHELLVQELPRLKEQVFKLRQSNYMLFLEYRNAPK